jgi:hypothetical protein
MNISLHYSTKGHALQKKKPRACLRAPRLLASLCALAIVPSGTGCRGLAPEAAAPFTVVMLPDTQVYSKGHPGLFYAQTDWVKKARDRENIVFVTQVGDIINDRSTIMSQWAVASNAMARLDGVVSWGVAIGNHDYDSGLLKEGVATTWLRFFGPERFKGCRWYGGASPNGLSSCQFFSGGGIDFLILQLEVEVPDEAIAWAQTVLNQHPNHAAIVATHAYLKGREGVARNPKHDMRRNGNSGEALWQKLIRVNPQIFMVLCGHEGRTDEYYQVSTNCAGNRVLEMLADYQKRENGGNGWLRLIRFLPASRQIQVRTYSPALDKFETDENSQFVVPWEMPAGCWRNASAAAHRPRK